MNITSDFDFEKFKRYSAQYVDDVSAVVYYALESAMIELVNYAKMTNTYIDQTNNLRSSIGYVIYQDGELIKSSFSASGSGAGGDGKKGVETGLAFAKRVAEEGGDKGLVCVLVAGMEYAKYVESKNLDVLTGATLQADNVFQAEWNNIKDALKKIKFNK